MDLFQYVLPSGHGVRVRLLKPSETDAVAAAAADGLSLDASFLVYARKKRREGARAMIVKVTKDGDHAADALLTDESLWKPWDPATYDDTIGADPRNDETLMFIYQQHHEIGPGEVAALAGKGRRVTAA